MLAGRMGALPNLFSAPGTYIVEVSDSTPFRMVTTGNGLVVAVCPELVDWSHKNLSPLSCGEAFEARWMAKIQNALQEHVGGALRGPDQVFYSTNPQYSILDSPVNRNFRLVAVSGADLFQYVKLNLFEIGRREGIRPDAWFEVAFVDNQPVGLCGGTPNQQGLLPLYVEVLPPWRSRGIGIWLARHAINTFPSRGYYAYCRCSPGNLKSIRLCHCLGLRLGWLELVGERSAPAPAHPAENAADLENLLRQNPWGRPADDPRQNNGRSTRRTP
jgi:GNAT superfamily N-acetyltransferase